jgi:hypothetical protein
MRTIELGVTITDAAVDEKLSPSNGYSYVRLRTRSRNQRRDIVRSAKRQGVRALSSNTTRMHLLVTVRVQEVRVGTASAEPVNPDSKWRSALLLGPALQRFAYIWHEAWTESIFPSRGYVKRMSPSKR